MWAARIPEGYVFGGMSTECVRTLEGVPLLLESRDPRVLERLYPDTCSDEQDEAQWREHAVPELERLFASRGTIVRKDLAAMRAVGDAASRVLLIPEGHTNAWLASLNAARLALYALNDLNADWMSGYELESATDKQREAIARIHLLAEIQAVLLGEFELEVADPDDVEKFAAEAAAEDDDLDGGAAEGDDAGGEDDGDDADGPRGRGPLSPRG
jgi:hypothetical protein